MFTRLLPRYIAAPLDDDRIHGLIALNTVGTNQPLAISGLQLANANALVVGIVDGTGAQVTSFGGGTQYTDAGIPPTHPVGPTLEFNNAGTWATIGSANPLPVTVSSNPLSIVSTNNSTAATLLSGAVFTGTGEDVLAYSEMRVTVFSNVASASDGISIQQSSDNTNWDITDTYTIAAATGKTYVVPRQARYFRIVYTNGGTNQASFRLQTILNKTGTAPSSQRPSDAYTNETDLVQNQVFLMGYNGSTWDRIRTVGTGVLSTSTVLTVGSAVIGKVSIDQTTPGTTNLVSLSAETTKVIGTVNQGTSPWVVNTSSATAASVPANAFYVGMTNNGNLTGLTSYGGFNDGLSSGIFLATHNSQFNGTNFDRTRSIINATDSTGTGIAAVGMIGQFDDVSPGTVTENRFGNIRMSVRREMYQQIRDAAGNERGLNISANNNISVDTVTTLTGTTTLTPGTGATNLGKAEDAAHTTADVGVFSLGVRNDTLADTTNANTDYTQISTDIKGRVMIAGAPRGLKGNVQVQLSATTAETTILAATASTFHDVYGLILANTGASTTKVSIRDDTAGTVRMIIEVPTLETRGFMLPVDSAIAQTAVNKNWTAQCGTSTTALEITLLYVSMV